MRTKLKKLLSASAAIFFAVGGILLTPTPSEGIEPVVPDNYNCSTTYFPQGDDNSYQMTLPFSLKLGQTEYTEVFVSTNGVISFGVSDATFWDYPNTPSITLAGYDWVTWGDGGYLRYGTTENTLCIQWAVRPFPQSSGAVTNITLLVDRASNGSWTGQIITDGWLPDGLRRGIRYTPNEPVVTIDTTFQVGASGVPIETQTCWDGTVIPATQDCSAPTPPELLTREVQCSWTNPYTQEVVYGNTSQQYYLYWDGSTVDAQTVAEACSLVTPPTFIEPDPTTNQREVQCSWTNPYTQEVVTGTAIQHFYTYWDGSTSDIETVAQVCLDAAPTFPIPIPVVQERIVQCYWANPYTQEVVNGTVTQRYNLFWDGHTEDIDSAALLCSDATPTFIEPTPELKERIVQCTWRNPYTREYVSGEATAQYNLYWNGSEVYTVSPETACALATPVFIPVEYPAGSVYVTANEGWQLYYSAPDGYLIDQILFASYGNADTATYQYGWCHADNSLTKVQAAVSGKTLDIGANNGVFGDPCGGTYKHLSVVLTIKVDPDYVPPTPDPTVECWDGSMVYDISECPIQPPPPPTYECWDGSVVNDVNECPAKPEPVTYTCWDGSVVLDLSLCPAEPPVPPTYECWDGTTVNDLANCPVEPTPTPEPPTPPTPEPVDPVVPPTPPTPPDKPDTNSDNAENVADDAAADGVITEEEKAQIVDALLEEYSADEAIPAGMIEELGLDYEDLPPNQPVTLENGVVITAEVADAIEIFESPSEVLATLFTDPSKALMAVANVGADLPPAIRKEAQKVAVASVIVTQVIAGTASLLTRRI